VTVRAAVTGDLPALVELENSSFVGDRMSRRSLARFLSRPTARLLVAFIGDRLAGYLLVLLHTRHRAARIYSLAVTDAFAGRGIGRALVVAGCEAARAAGRDLVALEVRIDNARAIDLYRRCGFAEIGRVEDYYEDGAAALKMTRTLEPAGGALP
jgi:ribosomal protein S18 acetylase RimI-like enzyme